MLTASPGAQSALVVLAFGDRDRLAGCCDRVPGLFAVYGWGRVPGFAPGMAFPYRFPVGSPFHDESVFVDVLMMKQT